MEKTSVSAMGGASSSSSSKFVPISFNNSGAAEVK
ncbi:hypothetical protein TIFTF001_023986 [Ficus carica]|uniref:Uncharacterized protein n=1 Tax=Ficus carica TaxID=3494 RepID=A0AA88AVC3_FICCA|nr:hypothetical protein TIFTF001_023986 [Ficus carica]